MVDSVIVTIRNYWGDELFDLELPCNIIISDLKKQLVSIPKLVKGKRVIRLFFAGKELNDNTSLSENEIWDGSYLTIRTEA